MDVPDDLAAAILAVEPPAGALPGPAHVRLAGVGRWLDMRPKAPDARLGHDYEWGSTTRGARAGQNDTRQTAAQVTNAIGTALQNRVPRPGTILHSDRGTQPGFKGPSQRLRCYGALPCPAGSAALTATLGQKQPRCGRTEHVGLGTR